MTDKLNPYDSRLFLESLKQDGVEEIYVEKYVPLNPAGPTAPSDRRPTLSPMGRGGNNAVRDKMISLREQALKCTACSELAATRKSVVFGAGNVHADLMFIGEAPGRDEDLQGLPFVGAAGQLLTKIIEAIGLDRKQVFIANVLKCRPPQNRQPQPDEILNCQPFLINQIDLIQPKIICALGTFAAQTLLKTGQPISRLRGRFHDLNGIRVMCTYHPAYLLRNPADKRKVWEDMKMIRKELDLLIPHPGPLPGGERGSDAKRHPGEG